MRDGTRADVTARALLTLGALLPYWRLLTFGVIFITDDYFASDIFNGELPVRVLIGRLIRHGQLPVWTDQLCSGVPLVGTPLDPLGVGAFTLLPAAPALDLFVVVLLLVAAHGAYGLARRFGADRVGAVLAGLAFAGSGYIACQLKHLSILSTVVWLPVGLLLIDRALRGGDDPPTRRAVWLTLFGLVFAQQVLCAFPQSAYICALVYGAFALFRATTEWRSRPRRKTAALMAALGAVTVLAAAAGAVVLLSLSAIGSVSDRSEPLGYEWSTRLAYWPPNILSFLLPYAHGDISNNSYTGPPFFWEDYGYVGIATFLLAIYGAVRERRRSDVLFLAALTVLTYCCVLGNATPVFYAVYLLIPGMKLFRFPTRFLFVVELGLVLLGAIGLRRLRADLERHLGSMSIVPTAIVVLLCAGTGLDLWYHQPRQNPMVTAQTWLAPPSSVAVIRADVPEPRTFTPRHRDLHRATFQSASGWSDVEPYFAIRDLLEPNLGGGLWNLPSGDCYAGLSARWYVDIWGDHNREASIASLLAYPDPQARVLRVHPRLPNFLRTYGVTHVLTPYPQQEQAFTFVQRAGTAYIYRVDDARRIRFVRGALVVSSDREAATRLLDPKFDPNEIILLAETRDTADPAAGDQTASAPLAAPAHVSITRETTEELVVDTDAPANGYLLLADTYYPGWMAQVDDRPTPLYRANIAVRGIRLPKGRHQVRFVYDPPGFYMGLWISAAAGGLLILATFAALYADRRGRRYSRRPIAPQTPITT